MENIAKTATAAQSAETIEVYVVIVDAWLPIEAWVETEAFADAWEIAYEEGLL